MNNYLSIPLNFAKSVNCMDMKIDFAISTLTLVMLPMVFSPIEHGFMPITIVAQKSQLVRLRRGSSHWLQLFKVTQQTKDNVKQNVAADIRYYNVKHSHLLNDN